MRDEFKKIYNRVVKYGLDNNRLLLWSLGIIAIGFIASVLLGSFFARPIGDDFLLIRNVSDQGLIGFIKDFFIHTNGRFSNAVFTAFYLKALSAPVAIALSPVIIVLSFWAVLTLLARTALTEQIERAVIMALISTAIIFLGAPSPFDVLYWFSSASVYVMALLCVGLLHFLLLVFLQKSSKPYFYLLLFIAAYVAAGFSEVAGASILLLCIATTILHYKNSLMYKKKINTYFLKLQIVTAFGLISGIITVLLMPATKHRINVQTVSSGSGLPHIFDSLHYTTQQFTHFLASYPLGVVLMVIILALIFGGRLAKTYKTVDLVVVALVLSLAMPALVFFSANYANSYEGSNHMLPFRVVFFATTFLAAGLFILTSATTSHLSNKMWQKRDYQLISVLFVFIALVVSTIPLVKNIVSMEKALILRSIAYDQRESYIFAQVNSNQGSAVTIPSIPILYKSHAVDINSGSPAWFRLSFARYYYLNPKDMNIIDPQESRVNYCVNQKIGWYNEKSCSELTEDAVKKRIMNEVPSNE